MNIAFIDRDGTLIYEPPGGLVRPEDFRVLPGVIDGLKKLRGSGHTLVMVSNQNFSQDSYRRTCYERTQQMLIAELEKADIPFAAMFVCPHSMEEQCACQKPKTGMVDAFLREHAIDRSASFVIGDRDLNDGGLAHNLGIRFFKMDSNSAFPDFAELRKLLG